MTSDLLALTSVSLLHSAQSRKRVTSTLSVGSLLPCAPTHM